MPNTLAPTKGMTSAKQPEFYQSISCLRGESDRFKIKSTAVACTANWSHHTAVASPSNIIFAGLTHVDLWVPVAGASVKLASLPADAPSWSIDQVR